MPFLLPNNVKALDHNVDKEITFTDEFLMMKCYTDLHLLFTYYLL